MQPSRRSGRRWDGGACRGRLGDRVRVIAVTVGPFEGKQVGGAKGQVGGPLLKENVFKYSRVDEPTSVSLITKKMGYWRESFIINVRASCPEPSWESLETKV